MPRLFGVLPFLLLGLFLLVSSRECPCQDESLCNPIIKPPGKEFLMFSTRPNVWRRYNWSKVTTIVLFRSWDDELFCEAHKRGVRVVLKTDFPTAKLNDTQYKEQWIANLTGQALTVFADGVNIDIEEPIPKGSPEVGLLTELVEKTTLAFHSKIEGSQVSFDVAWSPNCIDGRCYDASGLAKTLDFLVVMAYSEESQMKTKECIARANSPLHKTRSGVKEYLSLGIAPEKLLLGLPWMGVDYPCLELNISICTIQRIPFRGVNCSDAAGRGIAYSDIQDLIVSRLTEKPKWDPGSSSVFFNYEDSLGENHQVWYDNARSLTMKYDLAATEGLRGVALWSSDYLDYSDLDRARKETELMWDALRN